MNTLSGATRLDFSDGLALHNAGDYRAAITKFTRAYEASKEPRILYNIASSYEKLKKYVKARLFLKRFMDEATIAGILEDQRRAELNVFLETYDRLIGKLRV